MNHLVNLLVLSIVLIPFIVACAMGDFAQPQAPMAAALVFSVIWVFFVVLIMQDFIQELRK